MFRRIATLLLLVPSVVGVLTVPASASTAPTVSAASVFPAVQGSVSPIGDITVVEAAAGQLPVNDVITFRFKDSASAATLHFNSTPVASGSNGLKVTMLPVTSSSGSLLDEVQVKVTQSSSGLYAGVLTVAQLSATIDGVAATGNDQVIVTDTAAVFAAPATTADANVITSGTAKATYNVVSQPAVLSTASGQQAGSLTITEPAKDFFKTNDVITFTVRDANGSTDTVGLATTPIASGGGMTVEVQGLTGATVQQNESGFKVKVDAQDPSNGSSSTLTVSNLVFNTAQAPLGPITISAVVSTGLSTEYVAPGRVSDANVGGNTATSSAGTPWLTLGTTKQAAANVTVTVAAGSLKPGDTFSLAIQEPGVTFDVTTPPNSSVTVGNLVLGATYGTLDATHQTATWTVTSANTVAATVVIGPIYLDVAAGAVAGDTVNVTASGSASSAFTSQTVAVARLAPAATTAFSPAAITPGSTSPLGGANVVYRESGVTAQAGDSFVIVSPYASQIAAYRTTFAAIPSASVTAGGIVLGAPTVNSSTTTVVTPSGTISAPAQTVVTFPVVTGSSGSGVVTFSNLSYALGTYVAPGSLVAIATLNRAGASVAGNQLVDAVDTNGLGSTGVDTTPPDTIIDSGPGGISGGTVYNTNTAAFSFHSTEVNSSFRCTLITPTATVSELCTSPKVYPSLVDGKYQFQVAATDASYNTDVTPAIWNFTITYDTTPPTASVAPSSTTLTAPVIVSFSESVKTVTTTNVVLTLQGSTTPIAATLVCHNAAAAVVSCLAGPVAKAYLTPTVALVPGQHYSLALNPASALSPITDMAGNKLAATTTNFRGALAQQEISPAAVAAWRTVSTASASGGSYAVAHESGASASFTFTGTSVTWHTVTGPSQGKAYVYIDGSKKPVVDNYATSTHYGVARTFGSLTNTKHTIKVVAAGVKGATAGTDSLVAVDDFLVGATRTENTSKAVSWAWQLVSASSASGSHYADSNLAGSSYWFTFRGTAVAWYTVTGPAMGKATVYVDGVAKATYDNYSSALKYGVKRAVGSLSDAVHTVRVVVLGKHRTGAKGNTVAVDRFVVS